MLAIVKRHVETVNRDLSEDPKLAGSQIKRFIVLHKELDADDGELTRTRKVRRGFIGERYQVSATVTNHGTTQANSSSRLYFYLSDDAVRDGSDQYVAYVWVGALAPGSSATVTPTFTMPLSRAPGSQFLLAVTDGIGQVPESDEANNTTAATIDVVP